MQYCDKKFGQGFDHAVADLSTAYMCATPPCVTSHFQSVALTIDIIHWPSPGNEMGCELQLKRLRLLCVCR